MSAIKVNHARPGALDRIMSRFKKGIKIAVGFPASKTASIKYPDDKEGGAGESVATVAAQNNFGTSTIPARPFMTLAKKPAIKVMRPIVKSFITKINKGLSNENTMIEAIGVKVAAVFKNTIISLKEPPNSESTIQKKGSSNPLVDTGLMVQSLTFSRVQK